MPPRPELVADCRLRATVELLAHTWDPVVLAALRDGPLRRAVLRRRIGGDDGLRDKPLGEALVRLVERGLLARDARSGPEVVYRLTPLGRSFVEGPLAELGRWTEEHADDLTP